MNISTYKKYANEDEYQKNVNRTVARDTSPGNHRFRRYGAMIKLNDL